MNKKCASSVGMFIKTHRIAFRSVSLAIAAIVFFAPYHASAVSAYPSVPSITSPVSGAATTSPVTFSGTCDLDTSVSISGFGTTTSVANCSTAGDFSMSVSSSTADGTQDITAVATNLGWATTTPALNYGFGAYNFAANGYLYSAGGDDDNHNYGSEEGYLDRAPIYSDGTLGPWATTSVYDTYGQKFGGGVYLNGKIFLIGGVASFYFERLSRIKSFTLSTSTNSLGPLVDESVGLPAPQWKFSLLQNGDYIYTIGGMDNNYQPTNVVYFTKVDSDGTMHAWQSTTPLPANRVAASSFVLNGKVYVLGGRSQEWSAVDTNSVYHATINGDGTLGSWTQDADLPFGYGIFSTGNSMHIVNGYVYALGTGSDGLGTKYAQIQSDGSFDNWQTGPNLLKPVESQTVESGGNMYTLGINDPYLSSALFSSSMVQRSNESMIRYGGNTSSSTALSFVIDNTVPELASSWVSGQTLTLNYSKTLSSQAPATSTFTVLVDGATSTVSSVQVTGGSVILTLDVAVPSGHDATLSYSVPGSNPIQDNLGHLAVGLSSVTISPPPSGGFSTTYVTEGNTTYSIQGGVKKVFSASNVSDLWFQDYAKRNGLSTKADVSTTTQEVAATAQGVASSSTCLAGQAFDTLTGEKCSQYVAADANAGNGVTHSIVPSTALAFTKDLSFGMADPEVLALQRYLNSHGFAVSITGAGSPGNETPYFGKSTRNAVVRFQKANGITPAAGYFGPKSRAAALMI